MKISTLRTVSALSLSILLGACGIGNPTDLQLKTAATVETSVQTGMATASATGADTPAPAASAVAFETTAASANMPQPDCIADGCKGLRIIDGNAEAFRYAAMQRNADPQA